MAKPPPDPPPVTATLSVPATQVGLRVLIAGSGLPTTGFLGLQIAWPGGELFMGAAPDSSTGELRAIFVPVRKGDHVVTALDNAHQTVATTTFTVSPP